MATQAEASFATSTSITDDDIAEARRWIGRPLKLPARYNTMSTTDSIRHFAMAFGDDNPLWCDPEYASRSRHQTIVAPPTWPYSVFPAGIGPGFGGLQGFHAGGRWEFHRSIRPDEEIVPTGQLVEVRDVDGRRSGRTIIQTGRAEYRTTSGELVASNTSSTFRKPRPGRDNAMKVDPYEPLILSEAERDELEDRVLAYRRRGAEPRLWEDTSVGTVLDERVQGPLELNDITVFSVNVGIVVPGVIGLKRRRAVMAHPEAAPTNRPLEWLTNRTPAGQGHLEPAVAREVGVPNAYDNGWLRVCWMAQVVTDWMGDDADLKSLDVKIRLPNIVGDVLTITGSVVGSRTEGDHDHLVDVEMVARRQDGATSCTVAATVNLPTKLPKPLTDRSDV